MSLERAMVVGLEPTAEIEGLVDDIASASARAAKAEPGDRGDAVRFEALSTRLEALAWQASSRGTSVHVEVPQSSPTGALVGHDPVAWPDDVSPIVRQIAHDMHGMGLVPVFLVSSLEIGPTPTTDEPQAPPEAARAWRSSGARGREAVQERFTAQIEEALSASPNKGSGTRPISPSGIQNPVVTETLRSFVKRVDGSPPCRVPVEYRDGSRSRIPFVLRSLDLQPLDAGDEIVGSFDLELRFALLSIRHTEMDAVVHGAWLRNAQISRPRPAAQTDDMAYEITRTQLAELTSGGRSLLLYLYQTGLETAVVGFYKALTDHLIAHPGTVAVQPMYYSSGAGRRDRQRPTKAKGPKGRDRGRRPGQRDSEREPQRDPIVTTEARFRKGSPWAN